MTKEDRSIVDRWKETRGGKSEDIKKKMKKNKKTEKKDETTDKRSNGKRSKREDGRIVMITDENFRPYDRTKLSKTLSMTAEEIALRPVEFYDEANIEIMTATEAVSKLTFYSRFR